MRFLAELSGEHPTMPAAEFRALFEAVGKPFTTLEEAPRFLDGHAEVFADEAIDFLPRLGLTHTVCFHLFDGVPGSWPESDAECCLPVGASLAVRAARLTPASPWRGPAVERELGALLAPGRTVRLRDPEMTVRAYLLKERVCVGRQTWSSDPKALQTRHVENRPFFSPVSLEPKLARALINLARAPPQSTVYDPFCGTGGILLEAADMGLRALGSDLDPEMVRGARANLAHYGLDRDAIVFQGDVAEAPRELMRLGRGLVDAVVTDLPYGRSASTGKEDRTRLYRRAFEVVASVLSHGGWAVVGLPSESDARLGEDHLRLAELHKVRRHRSLTRHFAVYRQRN